MGDTAAVMIRPCDVALPRSNLAAWAPVLAAGAANDVTPTRLDILVGRSRLRRLSVDGVDVFLCGRGEGGSHIRL